MNIVALAGRAVICRGRLMIKLEKDGNVHVATMNNKENMISPEWQDRM